MWNLEICGEPYAGNLHVWFDEGAGVSHGASRSTLHPFGLLGPVSLVFRGGCAAEHGLSPYDWHWALDFADQAFKQKTKGDTK